MSIRISAVICTYNRAAYLQKAIQSLVDQTLPQNYYEIIVVDNASTDNTKATVEGFDHFENLRYIHEPIMGLSQARNTGWQNAQGEYIAYLDDDAIACPEWLERIVDAFDTVKPQPASVGGKVTPVWEAERPAWFPKEMETAFAIVHWGDNPKFLTEEHEHHVGCNVAYQRDILRACGGFNTNLGRKGTNLISNDESLILLYLRQHCLGIYYHPSIHVEHLVPAERLAKRFLYRRMFWQGVSNEVLEYLRAARAKSKWRYRLGAIASIPVIAAHMAWSFLGIIRQVNRANLFSVVCGYCYVLGETWGKLQIGFGRIKE